jgi:hypothetical protein
MADNVGYTPGVGATVAADDIGGVLHQRVKISLGADGVANDASAGAGAVGTGTQRMTLASDDPAVASLASILAKIIAAPATEAKQDTGNASLSVLDDWDESDRAKVNPIVGQAGVAAGAGAVGATVQRVTLASDDPAVAKLTNGVGVTASATFTPAAASHVANDVVGGAQQFSFGAPSGAVFMITDAEFEIDTGTAQVSAWRLYLYNVTPPSALADDTAWDLPSGDRASFLGYIDLGTAIDLGSTQWVESHGVNKTVKLSGTSVFGYLTNTTTLTTAAVAHIVKLYGTPI